MCEAPRQCSCPKSCYALSATTPGAHHFAPIAARPTYAVKSADPVTARDVSSEILVDQTAPLWPTPRQRSRTHQVERTKEGSNPVAKPVAQHWVAVLTGRDQEIGTILEAEASATSHIIDHSHVGELEMNHGPRVARAQKGLDFDGGCGRATVDIAVAVLQGGTCVGRRAIAIRVGDHCLKMLHRDEGSKRVVRVRGLSSDLDRVDEITGVRTEPRGSRRRTMARGRRQETMRGGWIV